jgi:F-type H+-transporting ATPase subunit c
MCVIGAGLGIGLAAYAAATSMARQPEVQGRLFTVFILASAFIEALALIGFVVTLIG